MGFTLNYRSTRPVSPAEAAAIEQAAAQLSSGRTWLSCEPVSFFPGSNNGHLLGGSKPNLMPNPIDAIAAAQEGLPDGTVRDVLDILCELSRAHDIDWEFSHDYSNGPFGHIRGGTCDAEVLTQCEAFADLGNVLGDFEDELDSLENLSPEQFGDDDASGLPDDDDDDDDPPILKFKRPGE